MSDTKLYKVGQCSVCKYEVILADSWPTGNKCPLCEIVGTEYKQVNIKENQYQAIHKLFRINNAERQNRIYTDLGEHHG